MARRDNGQQAKAAPKGAASVKDLEILQPDNEVTIGTEKIVCREYRYLEGLKIRAKAKPFFAALYAMFDASKGAPSFDDVSDVIGEHEETVVHLVAQSCDRSPDWVRELSDEDF